VNQQTQDSFWVRSKQIEVQGGNPIIVRKKRRKPKTRVISDEGNSFLEREKGKEGEKEKLEKGGKCWDGLVSNGIGEIADFRGVTTPGGIGQLRRVIER